jgi:hypothetical protein
VKKLIINGTPGHMVRFPRKAKTSIVKGVEEDREVAVTGAPKARAVTLIKKGQHNITITRLRIMLHNVGNKKISTD